MTSVSLDGLINLTSVVFPYLTTEELIVGLKPNAALTLGVHRFLRWKSKQRLGARALQLLEVSRNLGLFLGFWWEGSFDAI